VRGIQLENIAIKCYIPTVARRVAMSVQPCHIRAVAVYCVEVYATGARKCVESEAGSFPALSRERRGGRITSEWAARGL